MTFKMTTLFTPVILAIVFQWIALSKSNMCVKIDECTCRFDDGSGLVSLIDVASTDPGSPLVNGCTISSDEGIYYYYNPCFPFYKGPLYTTACIHNSTYGGFCEIGDWYTTDFSYNGVNVVAEYNGNDCGFQRTTTLVTLICDPFVESSEPTVLGRLTGSMFWLSIRSRQLCPKSELTTEEATTFSQTTQETTEIPFPTTAQVTTERPFPTTAPVTTERPFPTTAPETTERPFPTTAPVTTERPFPTTAPVTTERPLPTTAPVTTERPFPTTAPVTTERPFPTTAPVTTERPFPTTAPVTTERPFPTTAPVTTERPLTTSEDMTLGPTTNPAIICDYNVLLGSTLKRCVTSGSDSSLTLFAPPYLYTEDMIYRFCSNISWVNQCIQDAIQSCAFDGRVTAMFGSSGLGLQAAYESLCAHPFYHGFYTSN